jgi:hypothetical protein
MSAVWLATIPMILAFGCQGTIGDAATNRAAGSGADSHTNGNPGSMVPAAFQAAPAGLRPLTVSQYRDTISDLLGDVTLPEIDAETSSVAASLSGFSPLLVEQYETAALDVAHQAFASPKRQALVGCTPAGGPGDNCSRFFLASFGRRAWRRALDADEAKRFGDFIDKTAVALGDPWGALEAVVAALLESPNFLYRVELGAPLAAGGFGYSSQEMASRLTYFLWNAGPDDELLIAAERGDLLTDGGLSSAVDRALTDSRAHRGISRWFDDWLELDGLGSLDKDRTALPLMTDTLGASMHDEIMAVAEDAVFAHPVDAHQLFTTRSTFANAELAHLYGLAPGSGPGPSPVALPADGPRAGMLGWAGILALHAKPKKTFPTSRGKFIRMSLLCQNIPPPPPNVNTSIDFTASADVMTARQRLEKHRANPSCAACHSLTDPLGLALEHFDAIGAFRPNDNGLAIDTAGDLDGAHFADARELGERVAAHPDTMGCIARQLFRFASGHVETQGEDASIGAVQEQFASNGFHIKDALKHVVLSDAFRKASP